MKRYLYLLLLLPLNLAGQNKSGIYFPETKHDFGRISERAGYVRHRFMFYNTGDKPFFLSSVTTTCGCTTPFWTHDTIAPGDSGYVDAQYETYGHGGTFHKSVNVFCNGDYMYPTVLDVSGDVFDPETETGNPVKMLNVLSMDRNTLDYGNIFSDDRDTQWFRITNTGIAAVTINGVMELPDYLSLIIPQNSIDPQETIKIGAVLDASKTGKWGAISSRGMLITNLFNGEPYYIYFLANVKERFKGSEKQWKKSMPRMEVPVSHYDFGDVPHGAGRSTNFTIKNTGKSDLKIRKIENFCECLTISVGKETLAPGESTEINVVFDSITRVGEQQNRSFTIISNDPWKPERTFSVHAKLVK